MRHKKLMVFSLIGMLAFSAISLSACKGEEVVVPEKTGSIVIGELINGKISLSKNEGKVGDKITATVTPDSGYKLMTITYAGTNLTLNIKNVYEITLLEGKNEIKATFEKETTPEPEPDPDPILKTIKVDQSGEGTVKLSKEEAEVGEKVYATITPATDYQISDAIFNGFAFNIAEHLGKDYELVIKDGENILKVVFVKTGGSVDPDPDPTPDPTPGEKQRITFKTSKAGSINGDAYKYSSSDFIFEGVEVSSVEFKSVFLVDVGTGSGRLRVSSGNNSGSIKINFASPVTLGDVTLVGEGYKAESKVTIATDSISDVQTVAAQPTTDFDLAGTITSTLTISSPAGNRFWFDGLDLGGVKTEVDLSAKINKLSTTNGSYTISKESGVEGDSVEVITTPNEGYKTNSVIYNGTNLSPTSTDHYTFKMIRGTRDLSVSFLKESTGGGGGGTTPDNELMGNTYIASTEGSYYEGARGLKGIDLKNKLYEITRANHRKISYGGLYDAYETSDVPINPDGTKKNGSIYLTYSGEDITIATMNASHTTYNREHTWPKSYGFPNDNNNMYSDLHHLRPCYGPINSSRGNKFFADSTTSNTYNPDGVLKDTKSTGFKGDVARMMFYMATRYENSGSDIDLELRNVSGSISSSYYDFSSGASATMGDFESMFRWNAAGLDPVSDFEMNRNNVSHMLQGNRNPFIDHPEFAIMIYDKNYSGPGALND